MALCMLGRGEFDRAKSLTTEAFSPQFQGNVQNRTMEIIRECVRLSSAQQGQATQKSLPQSLSDVLSTNERVMRKILVAALAARRDFPGAIEQLTHVIRLNPGDGDAQIEKATYLAVLGKDEEAIAQYRTAVAAAPTNAIALSNLGALLAKRGQFQEAFPHYRAALATDPDNPDTRHNFAIALARNGQPLEAKREFEAVLLRKPDHQPATQQLAWLLATNAQSRDLPRALTLAESANSRIRTASSLDALAAVLAANRDFKGAVTVASEALELARREQLVGLAGAIHSRLQAYRNGDDSTKLRPSP